MNIDQYYVLKARQTNVAFRMQAEAVIVGAWIQPHHTVKSNSVNDLCFTHIKNFCKQMFLFYVFCLSKINR